MDSIDPDPPNDPDPADGPGDHDPDPADGPGDRGDRGEPDRDDDPEPVDGPDSDGSAPATPRHRRALRLVLFVAAAVIAGRVALSSPPSGTGDTATSGEVGDAGARADGGDDGSDVATTVVDDPDAPTRPERPAIDLAAVPQRGAPATEVARWWAATYAGWVGAETGEELADRLAAASTAALFDRLRSAPPPASFDEPDTVVGAATGPALTRAAGVQVLVTVETAGGVGAYQLDLVDTGADGWRVDAVTVL